MAKKLPKLTRRGFVRGAAMTGLVTGVAGTSTTACAPEVGSEAPITDLDRDELLHLAEALLPAEVEAPERAAVVDDLQRWLREYTPDAEMDHGYGFTRLRHTAPHPGREFADDLEDLRASARDRFGAQLTELSPEQTRELVAAAIESMARERTDIPGRPGADHVALAVLASYYDSPGAADRAYGVKIRKEVCRGLFTDVEEIPPYTGYAPETGQ